MSLAALYVVIAYRIGEASNPGPFHYGGASSSHEAAPVAATSGLGPAPDAFHARGGHGFDDPEGLGCEDEEIDDVFPLCHTYHEGLDVMEAADRQHAMDQVDSELQMEIARNPSKWPSAMVAWEVNPALVEGLIELPRIVEDREYGFETKEGWWVNDPQARQAAAAAETRATTMGIAGLTGKSEGRVAQERLAGSTAALSRNSAHARLATFQSANLPSIPVIAELMQEDELITAATPTQPRSRNAGTAIRSNRRKRGGRRRKRSPSDDTVTIWSFNSSGAPQLRAAVAHGNVLGADGPVAVLCQEHHAGPDQMVDLQAQLKSEGWSLAATRAVVTPLGGRSAGVGVCTPTHIMAGIDDGRCVDRSPEGSPGRLAAAWIHQIALGGVLVLSCYLHDSEEGTVRNLELLAHALQSATASGCPWIVGLDAQQPPDELLRWAAPAVDRANGVIITPESPTHFPGVGRSRTLDYFIVSRVLADAVVSVDTLSELRRQSARVDIVVAAKPHRVVRLRLRKKFQPALIATLRTPKAFPRAKPIGCARRPVVPEECSVSWATAEEDKVRAEGANAAWGEIVAAIEDELGGICDNFHHGYKGRHQEADVVMRPILPRRAAGPRGAMAQEEYAIVWVMNRLREMTALSDLHARGGMLTEGQWSQWDHLLRKICSPSSPIAGKEGRWGHLVEQLQRHRRQPNVIASVLKITFNWSVALANKQEKRRAETRRRGWSDWVKAQTAAGGGGGALFHFIKRTEIDPEIIVRCNGARSASPQAILEHDYEVWNGLWGKLSHLGSTPWRQQEPSAVAEPGLPHVGHEAIRKAAKSFKARTAVGVDALAPAHFCVAVR